MWVVRRNWSRASAGVLQPRVFRGLLLRAIATAARSSALCTLRSVPFGKYWRSSPLVFSFVPRCHGLWGSQKETATPASIRSWACWAISAPRSHVSDRRSCSGKVVIVRAIAPRTASAPCPARAGPFLVRASNPWPSMRAVAVHAGQVKQHREPRRALHQRADGGTAQAEDEVALPMTRHGSVSRLGRTLADQDGRINKALARPAAARPRHAQRPPGPQAGRQLTPQRPAPLHVKRLIDRLVADAHGRVTREVDPQAPGDLLRAPRLGPPAVLPTSVPAALPGHGRPNHSGPARGGDCARQALLYIRPQGRGGRKLGPLRASGRPLGMPLRGAGPIRQPAAARGGVAAQLARDRRRRTPQPASDLPYALALGATQRDLLAFSEHQIPPGEWLR